MEYKGGRIKEHRRQNRDAMQEDWLDVDWLDEDEETDGSGKFPEEEPLEIEDWRDEENWRGSGSEERKSAQVPKKKAPKRRPVTKPSSEGASRMEHKEKGRKHPDRRGSVQAAAKPVKAAGRAAGKAGKTAGKMVGRGVCIAMKFGCFFAMAVIVVEFWKEFWAERGTLGEVWRVVADRNYAQALYLGIVGVVLLYGILSAIWLLGGKRMPEDGRVKTYDTGRGLTSFVLFALFVLAAGVVRPLIPDSPHVLEGARLALEVAERIRTIVVGCCAAGAVLCVIRKWIGR